MRNFKQSLATCSAITLTILMNSITSFAAPYVRPNPPSYGDHRPGYTRPVPIRPNPIRPVPIRPVPHPIRPIPVPVPVPGYPPPVYPGPVYPGPGYPPPYEPPYYPNPTVQKSIYLNRYVQYEALNLTLLMGLQYNYQGYRVRHVYVDLLNANGARIDLLINNRIVDSRNTYGGDVYLYPNYNDQLHYEILDLKVGITGGAYINRITVELERY